MKKMVNIVEDLGKGIIQEGLAQKGDVKNVGGQKEKLHEGKPDLRNGAKQ